MTADNHNKRNDDDLLTSEETAELLGLKTKHTLEVWRTTKRYPELEYIKIGRLVRYKRSTVKQFIAQQTVGVEA